MQSLRVTLYEIFGYFAPGLIAVLGIAIALWSIYFPSTPLTADALKLRPVFFVLVGFVSYIIGHLLQAVGNLHARAEKRKKLCDDCRTLQEAAVTALSVKYQITTACENLSDVTALAFAIMSQTGKTEAYEAFVYREGFYRAGYLSFAILAFSFLLRAIHPAFIAVHKIVFAVPRSIPISCFLFCVISSIFFFLRFRRFGEYRVKHVLSVISVLPMPQSRDFSADKE